MAERVSSFGLNQVTLQAAMNVQAKYAEANTQQASGLVASTYGELGGANATYLISLETTQSRISSYSDTTQLADDRAQAMYSAIGSMIDQLESIRSTITAAKSDTTDSADLNSVGETALDDLSDLMNTRLDGRYLFAGSKTDTAPVDTSTLAVPTTPSTADTSYYTGDSEIATVRVSENQTISYGVTGDETGFEQALRSANILANLTTDPLDEDALDEAYDLATSAMDALLALQSKLSVTSGRLENALNSQDASLTLIDTMTSNVKDVDAAEIAVKVSEYQTQLTSSYSALANINKLNLVNYL